MRPSWSRDGRQIYFGGGDSQIWKAPAQGGAAVQLTKKGGFEAFESVDGNRLYYAKSRTPGIWRVPVQGGEEVELLGQVAAGLWALTEQGIFFFDISNPVAPVLKFYSFAASKSTIFRDFSKGTRIDTASNTALTVSPDGQWILYTQLDQSGSDLMLVENFR